MKKFNGFEVIENTGSSEQARENVAYKCGDEYRFCISVSSTNKKVAKAQRLGIANSLIKMMRYNYGRYNNR